MKILAVPGSLGARSQNLALLERAARRSTPDLVIELAPSLAALPFFDPDVAAEDAPAAVHELRRAVAGADALLIASPEYGHSLPGVLKNAIDWLIGSGELERAVVAITASVLHESRGRRGLAALRQTLGAVSAEVVWEAPIVRGHEDAALAEVLARLVEAVARRST